jgi:hypothetical protein
MFFQSGSLVDCYTVLRACILLDCYTVLRTCIHTVSRIHATRYLSLAGLVPETDAAPFFCFSCMHLGLHLVYVTSTTTLFEPRVAYILNLGLPMCTVRAIKFATLFEPRVAYLSQNYLSLEHDVFNLSLAVDYDNDVYEYSRVR